MIYSAQLSEFSWWTRSLCRGRGVCTANALPPLPQEEVAGAENEDADEMPDVQETVAVIPGSTLLWRISSRPAHSAEVMQPMTRSSASRSKCPPCPLWTADIECRNIMLSSSSCFPPHRCTISPASPSAWTNWSQAWRPFWPLRTAACGLTSGPWRPETWVPAPLLPDASVPILAGPGDKYSSIHPLLYIKMNRYTLKRVAYRCRSGQQREGEAGGETAGGSQGAGQGWAGMVHAVSRGEAVLLADTS